MRTCIRALIVGSLLLAACGSDDDSSIDSTARGTGEAIEESPPELRNFTVASRSVTCCWKETTDEMT